MKSVIKIILLLLISSNLYAQNLLETIKKSEFTSFLIDSSIYSEVTAKGILQNKNILIGGFNYGEDHKRRSVLFLYDPQGATLKNGYDADFLSYNLYEDNENFVNDIISSKDGGAYILGSSDLGNFYTGYLVKVDKKVRIDDNFMVAGTEDTGFIRIHNYKMVMPNTTDEFQALNDTTYCEPQNIFLQKDGKLLIVGVTRKQMNEDNYVDGESFVMRLLADGTIDNTYGINGVAHINPSPKCDDARTAHMNVDGSIIIYGQYNHAYKSSAINQFPQSYVTKVDRDGRIDRSFGDNGMFVFEMKNTVTNPVAIIEQKDKSLLFFSNRQTMMSDDRYYYGLAIFKLRSNGKLDSRFFNKGVQIITKMGIGFTTDVLKTADEKILICGTNQNLIKDQKDGGETLFRSENYSDEKQSYTEDELDEQTAIGFSMRLNEDGSLDKSYPKDGLFFTRKNDLRQKVYFSRIVPITTTELLVFGASTAESKPDVLSFMRLNFTTKLDFGQLASTKDFAMSFYPNPVKDKAIVDFQLSASEELSAVLIDMNGKSVQTFFQGKLFSAGSHKVPIMISNGLAKGIYIMTLQGRVASKSIKVIVQ